MANLANLSRPATFGSAIGEAARLNGEIIRNQVRTGKISHTYLMTGLKGSGKTTTARTLARALNCLDLRDGEPCGCCPNCQKILKGETMDVKEIDAARNNGVDFAKSIEEDASYQPLEMRRKVYILDECHCMTADAFSSLLKLIEEPPEWCVFVFCTTDPQKMPATIRSRCQEFRFKAVAMKELSEHLMATASGCGARLDADAAEVIARHSGGSVRDALMALEICLGEEIDITAARVNAILGIESWQQVFMMLDAVIRNDRSFIINSVDRYYAEGRRVTDVITDCMTAVTDRLRFLAGAGFDGNDEYHRLVSLLDLDEGHAFELADALREVYEKIRHSSDKGVLTVALLRVASVRTSSLLVRLQDAERRLALLESGTSCRCQDAVNTTESRKTSGKEPGKASAEGTGADAVELPDIFGDFFLSDFVTSAPVSAVSMPAVTEGETVPEAAPDAEQYGGSADAEEGPVQGMQCLEATASCEPVQETSGTASYDLDFPGGFFSDPEPVYCPSGGDSGFVPAEGEDIPFEDAVEVQPPVFENIPAQTDTVAEEGTEEEPEGTGDRADWSDGLSLDQLFEVMDSGATPEMKLEWECNVNSILRKLVAKCGRRTSGRELVLIAPDGDVAKVLQCCLDAAKDLGCVRVEVQVNL